MFTGLDRTVVGVDGCKGGWIAVFLQPDGQPEAAVFERFFDLIERLPPDAIIAVDMPIGLPETTGPSGRGPERLIRPLLGARQSSVFAIPSRGAIYVAPAPFETVDAWYAGHRQASDVARLTSEPPRGVSIQAFGLFAKIRELDGLLRADGPARKQIIESHPEAAFWRLNGETPLATPKKIKGRVNDAGMAERRSLLVSAGLAESLVWSFLRGAAADDVLDACAMLVTAVRHARGEARPYPDPPGRDAHGIPIAIWV